MAVIRTGARLLARAAVGPRLMRSLSKGCSLGRVPGAASRRASAPLISMFSRCATRPLATAMMRTRPAVAQITPRAVLSTTRESYTDKQAKTGRPISPHVSIYAFPITALSSITNRVTGCILTGGLTGISLMALVGADPAALMSAIGNSFAGPGAKVLISFPLIYHYLGGLRHFVWDKYPDLLYTKGVTESSWVLVGSSAFLSILTGAVVLDARVTKKEEKKE